VSSCAWCYGRQLFHGLQFDDNAIVHDHVDPVRAVDSDLAVNEGHWTLLSNPVVSKPQSSNLLVQIKDLNHSNI
jgi:hypothetical protein